MDKLTEAYNFYKENLSELLKEFKGKFLVIMDNEVKGSFETQADAYYFATSKFVDGHFLIQKVTDDNEDSEIERTFHSRVLID